MEYMVGGWSCEFDSNFDSTAMKTALILLVIAVLAFVDAKQLRPPILAWKDGALPAHEQAQVPPPKELWFTQVLDHFNFATQPSTYQQRYLIAGAMTKLLPFQIKVDGLFLPFATRWVLESKEIKQSCILLYWK